MTTIRSLQWHEGVQVAKNFPLEDLDEHLVTQGDLVWLDVRDPDASTMATLAEELSLDPLSVEDALSARERPKATIYPKHVFVTVTAATLVEDDDPGETQLRASQISAFVLPRGLVTVRRDDSFDMDAVVAHWNDNRHLLKHGISALLYGLLDQVVDGHFEAVTRLDDDLEELEDQLFETSSLNHDMQRNTFRFRKDLVKLRRIVLPMREVVNTVRRLSDGINARSNEMERYYEDLYDHVLRVSEWTESLRDMISSIFETNLSLQDARLNTVMKKLAGWGAVIAVPTAVTGWFGQNIPYPGFASWLGLVQAAAIIFLGTVGLYLYLRRKDWI